MFIELKENWVLLDHLEALFQNCNHPLENRRSYRKGLDRDKRERIILAC